ncbi:hypothetical protein LIER_38173 [Lithospermum erythrorhizon]|uniref:Uncharacterized protein n=1 Tax=Lithospermum erythrorhizon TaxID=34254 RepID=A0AAV3Q0W4_LITER
MGISRNIDEPCSSSSSSSMMQNNVHLSEIILQPQQESINEIIRSFNLHHFLISYFENSIEAFRLCEFLLSRIREIMANYRTTKRVMKLMKRVTMGADHIPSHEFYAIYKELASFALLKNPLSVISPTRFQSKHDSHVLLLHKLSSHCRNIRRKRKVFRRLKKAMACFLVVVCTALAITLSVFTIHSIVGIVASPVLMGSSCILAQRLKKMRNEHKMDQNDKIGAEFDVAAKGVFVLINDFDTISRLVRILSDQMDHNKEIVEMCIGRGNKEMLKEVSREFKVKENRFMQQLEELEECLYLCILNINRSRRIVVEKVIGC